MWFRKRWTIFLVIFIVIFNLYILDIAKQEFTLQKIQENEVRIRKRSVVCQRNDIANKKPYLLFLIGTEGTGHHLFEELVKSMPNTQQFEVDTIRSLAELWEPATSDHQRVHLAETIRNQIRNLTSKAHDSDHDNVITTFLVQRNNMFSFPYNGPRNSLRRPDVIELIDLFHEFFNIRLIVAFRSPKQSISSLVRRGWWGIYNCVHDVKKPNNTALFSFAEDEASSECGHIHVQARVVEDSLIYIQYQLKAICSDMYRVVHYEDFTEDPLGYAKPLSQFAQLELEPLQRALEENVHKAGNHSSFQTDEQLLLDDIFNSFKQNQWIFLLDQQINLKNYQSHNPSPLSYQETCVRTLT